MVRMVIKANVREEETPPISHSIMPSPISSYEPSQLLVFPVWTDEKKELESVQFFRAEKIG